MRWTIKRLEVIAAVYKFSDLFPREPLDRIVAALYVGTFIVMHFVAPNAALKLAPGFQLDAGFANFIFWVLIWLTMKFLIVPLIARRRAMQQLPPEDKGR